MKGQHYDGRLEAKIVNGALTIRIGAAVLAHAVTYSDWANPFDEDQHEYVRTFAITDVKEFAKDVVHAMLREAEDGSTPLSDFLDAMTKDAVEDGSIACECDQNIKHGETSPLETWAAKARVSR